MWSSVIQSPAHQFGRRTWGAIHWGQGKRADQFLTVIYQIDSHCRRLLWVGRKRTRATLRRGLATLGPSVGQGKITMDPAMRCGPGREPAQLP
jgi:hypothetical protein